MTETYDAIVIGGGSAGLAFAKRASRHGVRIAMVERDALGGTCVNRGCVPKKMLWHVAHVHRTAAAFAANGELDTAPEPAFARAHDVINEHIETIRESYRDTLDERDVELVRGSAQLIDQDGDVIVRVGENGTGRTLHAPTIVIACGTKPTRPDLPGIDLADTSDDAFGWDRAPESLVIVGGGYIGVEFATVMSAFGSRVTLIESGEDILDGFDPDAVRLARRHLERDGVRIITNAQLDGIERSGNGLRASFEGAEPIDAERVLVAIGRSPRTKELGPIATALETADNGTLKVSETFETSRPGLYAVGDAADRMPLTPVARRDGAWLADHLFGERDAGPRLDLDLVATSAFCDPPVAQVGTTGADQGADDLYVDSDVGAPLKDGLLSEEERDWRDERIGSGERGGRNGTEGLATGRSHTLYKLLTRGKGGPLRGAVLVSRTAPDEIAWAAAAIEGGLDLPTLRRPAPVHPTFAEEFMG